MLAIIPARFGSKALPYKNRKKIGGRSLVELAIRAALFSHACDFVAVTTDDPELLRQARRAGAIGIRRPKRLATDSSPTMAAITHAVAHIERRLSVTVDAVVVLEPTTPLRTSADVRAAVLLNQRRGRPNVAGVTRVPAASWLCRVDRSGKLRPLRPRAMLSRRQDAETTYVPNGALYVVTRDRLDHPWYERATAYVMPKERSIDIDDEIDLRIARAIAAHRKV